VVARLDRTDSQRRSRLVERLDLPPTRVNLTEPWRTGMTPGPLNRHFARMLGHHLPPGRRIELMVEADAPPEPRRWAAGQRHFPPPPRVRAFRVQVALADGSPVTFYHRVPAELFARPDRLLLALLVLLVAVVTVSVLAVRALTRPLAWLAAAAGELGRNIHRPPLTETGPAEVSRAARAFNIMQTRLQRYIQDRSRILAAVSHDLKTPITRLRLRAELLEDEDLRSRFQADLDEMEAMVQATLDFMRGTEQAEQVVQVDMDALLESLQEDQAELGGEVAVQGRAAGPYPGRPLALKRCLGNLLDNAVRYGQRAEVVLEEGQGGLRIIVADQGPGVPEGELERVFEPFYRLEESRARHTGGTGLGLGIARNIARAHGGELTLGNRPGGGLEAVLELPR
ncbi:MAG: ATP-binding protein, partial [Candidatus Competibacteraceae bacterium]|nr:ATP-binding protein [Candidatus Competibacteraceae bacterium]